MKKLVYLYGIIVGFIAFLGAVTPPVSAASFQQTYIRLDRQKTLTNTSGMICATPASAGTEAKITITFPTAFGVNPSTAVWTVSIAELPVNSSAWPGIGTAITVAGQAVTFPSSDLLAGTHYCFRFTNASALINPTAADNYNGTLISANASSTPIDSSTYALSVIANDQVTVTASVLPSSSDLTFTMTSAPASSATLREDNPITFTVSYQSNYATTTPLTIVASWEKGTVAGSGTQIDVFNYDIGSATNADDGTVPVIDLVNRTITWNIPALGPSATLHTVSFVLRVRSSIPTQNQITSSVQAIASVDNAQLHQEQITFTIQATPIQPTATSTPSSATRGPSATPVPPIAAISPLLPSPTTVSSSPPHIIKTVEIREVTNTNTSLIITTSTASTYVLLYGTNPTYLTKRVTGLTPETSHTIELVDLTPDTQYYFTIITNGTNNDTSTSDIFTFRTAHKNEPFVIAKDSMNIAFQQVPLTDSLTESILIPVNMPFTIHLNTSRGAFVKDIFAKIQSQVLGITETKSPPPVEEVRLIEVLPGVFSGDILAPKKEGTYIVVVTIYDIYGGIHTLNAPYRFVVSPPITILNDTTREGIENATVIIQKYEENVKTYTSLPKGVSMDIRTDERGELPIALPRGKYIINVSSNGYQEKHIEFVIDEGTTAYPSISLIPDGSISATVRYIASAVVDTCTYLARGMVNTLQSPRVRAAALVAFEVLLLGFSITLLRIRRRMNMLKNQRESFMQWLTDSCIIFLSDTFMIMSLISLAFIIRYQGWAVSVPLILISLLLTGLWVIILRDLWIMQTEKNEGNAE